MGARDVGERFERGASALQRLGRYALREEDDCAARMSARPGGARDQAGVKPDCALMGRTPRRVGGLIGGRIGTSHAADRVDAAADPPAGDPFELKARKQADETWSRTGEAPGPPPQTSEEDRKPSRRRHVEPFEEDGVRSVETRAQVIERMRSQSSAKLARRRIERRLQEIAAQQELDRPALPRDEIDEAARRRQRTVVVERLQGPPSRAMGRARTVLRRRPAGEAFGGLAAITGVAVLASGRFSKSRAWARMPLASTPERSARDAPARLIARRADLLRLAPIRTFSAGAAPSSFDGAVGLERLACARYPAAVSRPPQPLPVDAALGPLRAALRAASNAVLEAPPGAGKTTRVPLALMNEPWRIGRVVMLEPRRLAARAAAARMAETLGEPVGASVGFRIRGATAVGPATVVEVVTEGVLTRMLQADPSLAGVSAVIFDEIHERSIHADLGLALCLEAQGALRPDLRLLAMSATLDAGPVAALMGAPVLRAEGRAHPVETYWRDAPLGPRARLEEATAETLRAALEEREGDALAFLPGAAEIARAAAALGRPPGVDVLPLHGGLSFAAQRRALAPAAEGKRKIVLATAIAETSLTVPGVRIVVDAGRARRARFDPGSGMTRLVDERASRAESDQRRGRAGRVAPGACWRLWTRGEEGGAPAFAPPGIATADLAPLALELAAWGAADPAALAFLDQPPAAAFAEARALLGALGALDPAGRITARGRAMAAIPLHPRLAHMTLAAEPADRSTAAALAALLTSRDPLRAARRADATLRLEALADPRGFARRRGLEPDRAALAEAAETRRRLDAPGPVRPEAAGRLLALAYPDRVAMRRPGDAPRFLLSGGKGAALDPGDALAGATLLAVADTDGDPREARIRLAAPLSRAELDALGGERIETAEAVRWDRRARAVLARRETRLGALVLDHAALAAPDPEATAQAMAEGARALGLRALPWTPAAERLRARVARLGALGEPAPDWSDAALLAGVERWLGPWLHGLRRAADLSGLDLAAILAAGLDAETRARLDRLLPDALVTPAGSRRPIDYGREAPTVSARAQEFYGLDVHPEAGGAALALELLSPAGRPIATTRDLPGFWRGGWRDARKEMRGRYPKHDWPERPWEAAQGGRAARRGRGGSR